mmetsp:Transcript_3565/g.10744  ORF Transcript_3565/g.10744 Transcript_3565/m.10744 type:complete len:273 (+) Transcript_3565:174-992(+)|eukprot:CAMPEP_0198728154 /NCGR_PEP_ID=MMETSP1475-20131203/7499_1 /TAXON_ID= ORGANISM="Unidentified sp., Strain CCMP1999" /NCGR_SAMPLE_ID=MMETSP1475 /ASSEMBLY_ACC=CAM_ASM_001111 /LENGTH=272 /DNA_ID=CAMNT_0044490439 /DNA_START=102 /DNA_END=920 /DNA_ORIENTATION=-
MDLKGAQIGFVGGGMMAEAIAKGLVNAKMLSRDQIWFSEPYEPRVKYLKEQGWQLEDSNAMLVKKADVIFLAVKPNVIGDVAKEVCEVITAAGSEKFVVSIAAGISIETLCQSGLPTDNIVRVMPNTPALVGTGASAVSGSHKERVALVSKLMSAVGVAVEVPEYQLDAVTCVSGSGPAYVYVFIESLADAGVLKGLSREAARKLAVQTVLGAARMVEETGEHPAQLRNKVESPGGTTIAAVRALEENSFRSAIYAAVEACDARLKTLSGKL